MSEKCPGFGSMDDLAAELTQRERQAQRLTPSMFPASRDGEVVASGEVIFSTGGLFGHDTECLQTTDGNLMPHSTLFIGLVGKTVRVIRDSTSLTGFRVEELV